MILTISIIVALVLIYPAYYRFSRVIRELAKKEKYSFELKENRWVEVTQNKEFLGLILTKAGACLLHQYPGNTLLKQKFHWKINDQGKFVAVALAKERDWISERDKWQKVECAKSDFNPTLIGLNWFQRWCVRELSVYWYAGWLFQNEIDYRPIDLYKFTDKQGLGLDGKPTTILLVEKITPELSKSLFAGDTVYSFFLPKAEDSTGNPVDVWFSAIGACVNGYVAKVDNERWDLKQKETVLSAANAFIKTKPFVMLNRLAAEYLGKKDGLAVDRSSLDEITDLFCKAILDALNAIDDGFHYTSVTLRNVDPSDERLRTAILELIKSEVQKEVVKNEADGKAYAITTEKTAENEMQKARMTIENEMYKEKMVITGNNLKAAAISQISTTFSGLKALSIGNSNGGNNLFTSMLNLEEENSTKEKEDEKKV